MKVVIAGGQTGGPIMPLLAVVESLRKDFPRLQLMVLDTPSSTAKKIAKDQKFIFYPIRTGKLRRYWSLQNLLAPFWLFVGFIQSLYTMVQFKPNIVLGAGGFVQVPVIWAAWVLRIPILIHQQDVNLSLSNFLTAPCASKITTTFESSVRDFHSGLGLFGSHKKNKKNSSRVVWTGNPFRHSLKEGTLAEARKYFGLSSELPVLLVTGGGSGAQGLNSLVVKALPELTKTFQIIHITGPGKKTEKVRPNYNVYEFIEEIQLAYLVSDIVVSRAGVSTITELANLGKVTVIIPMPNSHQESNANLLYEKQAAVPLDQTTTTPEKFVSVLRKLILDGETQKYMKKNISEIMPKNSAHEISKIIVDIIHHDK